MSYLTANSTTAGDRKLAACNVYCVAIVARACSKVKNTGLTIATTINLKANFDLLVWAQFARQYAKLPKNQESSELLTSY